MMKKGWRHRPLRSIGSVYEILSSRIRNARRKRLIRRTMIDVRNLSEHTRRDIGWIDG